MVPLNSMSRTHLLLIRAGFVGNRRVLTKKGRGPLPPWVWRCYVKVRCELDMHFRARVIHALRMCRDIMDVESAAMAAGEVC